jgi:ribosomal protein S18 acetylase RimI-like enzyme
MNRTQRRPAGGLVAAAIRPVRPADLPALSDFFAGLSMQTRYLRFFSPVTPGPVLLHLLAGGGGTTDTVVATRGHVIIGHAMATDRTGPGGIRMTDIGLVVADAWQGQGVGSALLRALIAGAQARGVSSVVMDVLPGNRQVLALIKGYWPAARASHSPDYDTFCVQLPDRRPHWQQVRPARPGARRPVTTATAGRVLTGLDPPNGGCFAGSRFLR